MEQLSCHTNPQPRAHPEEDSQVPASYRCQVPEQSWQKMLERIQTFEGNSAPWLPYILRVDTSPGHATSNRTNFLTFSCDPLHLYLQINIYIYIYTYLNWNQENVKNDLFGFSFSPISLTTRLGCIPNDSAESSLRSGTTCCTSVHASTRRLLRGEWLLGSIYTLVIIGSY